MASVLDRILNRKPQLDQPRSDSGRAHYGGFLAYEEVNPDLRGIQGLRKYDQMYRGDHDIRRNIAMIVNPLVGATWSAEPFGADEATDEARQQADDFAWALGLGQYANNSPNLTPWAYHLAETLPVLFRSGFCPNEAWWCSAKRDGRDLVTPRKFGLRLPRSIHRWITNPQDAALKAAGLSFPGTNVDEDLLAVEQFRPLSGGYILLPREDLLYYRVGAEGDNWEGTSMLRPVYKAWLIKDKIERLDAMGIEREAVGLPVVFPPKGASATADVLTDMEDKLASLRAGELAYLMMPGPDAATDPETGWTFRIEGLAGGGAGSRNAQPTLQYWRDAISTGFVQEFMRLGQGGTGSKGAMSTAEIQDDPFTQALMALAAPIVSEVVQIIGRRFMTLNYGADTPLPTLTMSLTEGDLAVLVDFVAGLVTAQSLHPDDELEDFLRQRGKLPPADKAARDQRHQQEQQQADLEVKAKQAALAPPAPVPGANGSEKVVSNRPLPGGGAQTKETVRHLDAPVPVGTGDRVRESRGDLSLGKAGTITASHVNDEGAYVFDVTWDDGTSGKRLREWSLRCVTALDGDPSPTPPAHSTRDAGALQIVQPVVGACAQCGKHHDSDECPPTQLAADQARPQRPWEQLMPLDHLEATMDAVASQITAAATPYIRTIAADAAAMVIRGQDPGTEPPQALTDAITGVLTAAQAAGAASVHAELAGQHTGHAIPVDPAAAHVVQLAASLPGGNIGRRALLIGRAVVSSISNAVLGRNIDGITDAAVLQAAGETAGDTVADLQGRAHAGGAVNDGREDAAAGFAHLIKGARYTSILDRNRCQECAQADDGVLRSLTDPVRLARRPPNPACRSVLSGRNHCRCMEFYELNDEAPANLEEALGAWLPGADAEGDGTPA